MDKCQLSVVMALSFMSDPLITKPDNHRSRKFQDSLVLLLPFRLAFGPASVSVDHTIDHLLHGKASLSTESFPSARRTFGFSKTGDENLNPAPWNPRLCRGENGGPAPITGESGGSGAAGGSHGLRSYGETLSRDAACCSRRSARNRSQKKFSPRQSMDWRQAGGAPDQDPKGEATWP